MAWFPSTLCQTIAFPHYKVLWSCKCISLSACYYPLHIILSWEGFRPCIWERSLSPYRGSCLPGIHDNECLDMYCILSFIPSGVNRSTPVLQTHTPSLSPPQTPQHQTLKGQTLLDRFTLWPEWWSVCHDQVLFQFPQYFHSNEANNSVSQNAFTNHLRLNIIFWKSYM